DTCRVVLYRFCSVLIYVIHLISHSAMIKLLQRNKSYLCIIILLFCMFGTYSINNSVFYVAIMLIMGLIGLFMLRFGFPAGPTVLGLILGPLAESNLRRTLIGGGWEAFLQSPIAMILFIISAAALLFPPLREMTKRR